MPWRVEGLNAHPGHQPDSKALWCKKLLVIHLARNGWAPVHSTVFIRQDFGNGSVNYFVERKTVDTLGSFKVIPGKSRKFAEKSQGFLQRIRSCG